MTTLNRSMTAAILALQSAIDVCNEVQIHYIGVKLPNEARAAAECVNRILALKNEMENPIDQAIKPVLSIVKGSSIDKAILTCLESQEWVTYKAADIGDVNDAKAIAERTRTHCEFISYKREYRFCKPSSFKPIGSYYLNASGRWASAITTPKAVL